MPQQVLLTLRWNPEVCGIRWRNSVLRMRRLRRNPAIGHRLRPVNGVGERAPARVGMREMRVDVLPHNLALRCDLEEATVHAFIDERIAVRKPLRVADERAVKGPEC